jgi:hypothetical protein
MSAIQDFEKLPRSSPEAILDSLEATLAAQKDYHRLFDARLIRARYRLGMPITQPTSLKDVPKDKDAAFREAYTTAAREIGLMLLESGHLADAWAYLRTIHHTEPIRAEIERRVAQEQEQGPALDELLNVALYEGAHTVEGIRLLLKSHGTCNTVTAMSQIIAQMTPEERRRSAAIMVSHLYADLKASVRRDLERRQPMVKPGMSLREMIAGKEFLFADGNYHIDVSHLHSIVGFARHLQKGDPELLQAVELAQYGSQLSEHLRYPADVPFDDYYVASEYFLKALAGKEVDEALAYFTQRLNQEPDAPDKRMIAFVLVDLAQRVGKMGPALETAAPHLNRMDDPNGFSFTASCIESGRLDLLEATARENDDVLAMATILLSRR